MPPKVCVGLRACLFFSGVTAGGVAGGLAFSGKLFGWGVPALAMATFLLRNGVLDVRDIQREVLVDLARRAVRKGLANIVPAQGDAQKLPYADRAFDAAYLIGGLGEIP